MKTSRKVFAVLSVALPLMLVASMTAHAESSSSSSSSSSKSSVSCPNIEEKIRVCESQKMIYEKYWENGCYQIKCREDWRTSSSSSKSSVSCPNVTDMIRKCESNKMTYVKYWENGCDYVKCKEEWRTTSSSSSWSSSWSSSAGSVVCERTVDGNFWVFECKDGKALRFPIQGMSSEKKPLPPAPKRPCSDVENAIVEVKAALEKNSTNVDLQKRLQELTKKLEMCQKNAATTGNGSSTGTSSSGNCKTEIIDNCKVTRCPGRAFKVCS